MRILVVDSDVHIREVLVQRLRGRGHDADGAQTAAEAVDMMSAAKYDIVLLEIIMPHAAVLDMLAWMRKLASPPRCIVMSGVANLWKRANPDVPVAGVLQKPFAFEDLLRLIA
ncbi:MAG TPA: response regulator [Thermoanaerobaculia bacterium]|jgi:DNA-binding response OmpR family regulator|nr:response regulator [Thermoanaerobaculia bacterium]